MLPPWLTSGLVFIDYDCGHWKCSKKAVDEYIGGNDIKVLLKRIDFTERIGVKI